MKKLVCPQCEGKGTFFRKRCLICNGFTQVLERDYVLYHVVKNSKKEKEKTTPIPFYCEDIPF